jgi:GT2 family glycosyltransferase
MPENSVWGAHYLVPENSTWVGRVWAKYQAVEREGLVSFIPGSNLFIKRADFERIGGFDASLKTSEDVEICNRASKHGMELVAYRMLAVFHEGTPQTLHGFYRQNRWHGESVARIFLANLPSMNNVHIVALSVYTLLAFWATVIVAPLELLHHRPWTAAVALLLLLLPALLLALQKTARAGGWRDMPALSALYFIYLLARAASLTKLSGRSHR